MTVRITAMSFDGPDANPGTIRAVIASTAQALKRNGGDPGVRYVEGTAVDSPKMLAAPVKAAPVCEAE